MAIFYWNNNGRLGNLLFQYAAILLYTTMDDTVFSFRHEAMDVLDIDSRFRLIPGTGRVVRKINLNINSAARFAVQHRLIGYVKPEPRRILDTYLTEADEIARIEGLVRGLFILQGYFQFGRLRKIPVRIKPTLMYTAKRSLRIAVPTGIRVAVHIRLSDYRTWTVLGRPGALIPAEWYETRMEALRRRLKTPTFVIFSDDIAAARQFGFDLDAVYFQGDSTAEDFAAMALCDHAIISPSSFAWWAAFAIPRADKIVMAPEYWAGFKSQVWYPPTMRTEGVEYYQVPE